MRIRIVFSKTEALRYTGNLDLHRAWERTFRRARLPLAYSQGYHPQPKINLACALPLGFTSQCEVVDAWLERRLSLDEIEGAILRALPPGLYIHSIEEVDGHSPALQTQIRAAEYVITLIGPVSDLDDRLERLLAATCILRERRGKPLRQAQGKPYDLRPLIEELSRIADDESGLQCIRLQLSAREGATGRPEEVLNVLGIPIEAARVHRTALIFV
jgi:radical SAM-linked protein